MHLVSVLCIPVSSIPTSLSFLKSFCPCIILLCVFNIVYEFGKVNTNILCVQISKIINFTNILDNGNCMACASL